MQEENKFIGILIIGAILLFFMFNGAREGDTSENESASKSDVILINQTQSYSGGGGGGATEDPVNETINETGNVSTNETETDSYNNWSILITSTNQLESNTFGANTTATDGYDAAFDTYTSFPQVGQVILSLDSAYAVSIKDFLDNTESWSLGVSVPAGQSANLSLDLTNLRPEVNVSFSWDSITIDIRENQTFNLGTGTTNINITAVG